PRPRTLASALRAAPDANIALISIPGLYAAAEARRALRAGLHVMLFSDNVPVEQEIDLKRLARERRPMLTGPDCGPAIVNGGPLGGTVARRLESQIARLGKPCALHFVGSTTASLEDCARDAVALARGEKHQPVAFTIPDAEVAHMVSEARRGRRPEQRFVRGV